MVVIRLARGGAKKRPFYHLVVADSRAAAQGKRVECLGIYNPIATGGETLLKIYDERMQYWLKQGAIPSQRVARLLKDHQKSAT